MHHSFFTSHDRHLIVGKAVRSLSYLITIVMLVSMTSAIAQPNVFRIGTGGSAGSYFPIGSLLAEALAPGNDEEFTEAAHNILLLAQRSSGSVANVNEIQNGLLESGLAQADIAHWAYHGTGPFQASPGLRKLRTIASLYLESLHLVARNDANINNIGDLVGRRVSIDEVGSGTEPEVVPILKAFSVSREDIKIVYLKPTDAINRIRRNQLDAFFIVAGTPVAGVTELVEEGLASIVPIDGPAIEDLLAQSPFIVRDSLPADIYATPQAIPTVSVAAQWIVSADLDSQLVYELTRRLWNTRTAKILSEGHPKGREVRLETSLVGIGIPLHPGAERFYMEAGLSTPTLSRQ